MRTFSIPFVIDQEEKMFGGVISIRQAIYLLLGALSGFIFFTRLHISIKIIIFATILTIMLLFAFLKINDTNFDKYTLIVIKYLMRKKRFLFGKEE